jgi:methionyl-tRNA formyltransferase
MRSAPSAVKALAQRRGLEVFQPATLRTPEVLERLRAARADLMVVAAYGLLLSPEVLGAAAHGAVNIHASLLPRWRGAAPIQRALLAGDAETGVSIMHMDAGLDTGPVYTQRRVAIDADDDAGTLQDKLAELGAQALVQILPRIASGAARPMPQPADGATYARKIEKNETLLDWKRPAAELERAVRAFRPAPGAQARLGGEAMKIWRARVAPGDGDPGTVLEAGDALRIACGRDVLVVDELQAAGGRRMNVRDFLRGRRLAPGMRLG